MFCQVIPRTLDRKSLFFHQVIDQPEIVDIFDVKTRLPFLFFWG